MRRAREHGGRASAPERRYQSISLVDSVARDAAGEDLGSVLDQLAAIPEIERIAEQRTVPS